MEGKWNENDEIGKRMSVMKEMVKGD